MFRLKKPILFNFFQHLDDHISRESPLACKRIAELYAKYGIKADFWPITLSLQNYLKKAPETIETIKKLNMGICYHTLLHYRIEVSERIRTLDWDEAVEKATFYESHWLNPLTGEYDPEKPGGIALIKEVFGKPPMVAMGSGAHLYAQKKLGARMTGLGFPLRWKMSMLGGTGGIHGPTSSTVSFMPNLVMSQVPQRYGPRMVWEDETNPAKPVEVLKHLIEMMPRDRINIIILAFHPFQFVFHSNYPGWGLCYRDRVGGRGLPPKLWSPQTLTKEETDRIFKEYEEVVAFVAGNPEFKVVTAEDIYNMVVPLEMEKILPREKVAKTAEFIIYNWGRHPPEYVDMGDDYLSLADAFQALAYSLAYYSDNRMLQERITIHEILGPTDTPLSLGIQALRMPGGMSDIPPDLVTAEDLLATIKRVAAQITDRIPGIIQLEGRKPIGYIEPKPRVIDTIATRECCFRKATVNPAELLYMMAQEYLAIHQNGRERPVVLKPSVVSPTPISIPRTMGREAFQIDKQEWFDILQDWTVKPAKMKPLSI